MIYPLSIFFEVTFWIQCHISWMSCRLQAVGSLGDSIEAEAPKIKKRLRDVPTMEPMENPPHDLIVRLHP